MRITEITTPQPKTPDALKVDALKATKDRANDALNAERKRQQMSKAQKTLATVNKPIKPPTPDLLS